MRYRGKYMKKMMIGNLCGKKNEIFAYEKDK
jgi:hypothetical protein